MKKFLKRALPIVLAVALVFTLSAGAFAAIPTIGLFELVERWISGSTGAPAKGVLGVLSEISEYSGKYFEENKDDLTKPVEPKEEDYQGDEEAYNAAMAQYEEDLEDYHLAIAEYAASVVGIAGTSIASGDVILPTYIDVPLHAGVEEEDILAVRKGLSEVSPGVDLVVADVNVAGLPDTYTFYGEGYFDPSTDQIVTNPFIRVYNYDTSDVTITVLFVEEREDGSPYLEPICITYSMDNNDLGDIADLIYQNKSAFDPVVDVHSDVVLVTKAVKKTGFLAYIKGKIQKKLAAKSFLDTVLEFVQGN